MKPRLKEALIQAAAAIDDERYHLDELTSIAGNRAIAVQLDGLRWEIERAVAAIERREKEQAALYRQARAKLHG